jgi:hypothetical protein
MEDVRPRAQSRIENETGTFLGKPLNQIGTAKVTFDEQQQQQQESVIIQQLQCEK